MKNRRFGLNCRIPYHSNSLRSRKGHLTDKSDDKVGHLNTILARGGGSLNDPIFKSSNARGLPGGGGDVEVSI